MEVEVNAKFVEPVNTEKMLRALEENRRKKLGK
jgi:hypothetical protein